MTKFRTFRVTEPEPELVLDADGVGQCNVTREFLRLGKANFRVTNPEGQSLFFQVKARMTNAGKTKYMVLVRDKHQRDGHVFGYVGVKSEDGWTIKSTGGSQYLKGTPQYDVAQWAFNVIFGETPIPAGYEIMHIGKCGGCARVLHPDDQSRMVCPSCAERI